MTESRRLLQHFLAAIAYRTQKALRDKLAMLRRLAGSPVPSENFVFADVSCLNVGREQAAPRAPDSWWRPNDPPPSSGPNHPALRRT